jgi:hypothetical protein
MVYVLVSNFSQPSKPTIRKLVGTASTHCYAQAAKAGIQRFFNEINSQRFKGYEFRVSDHRGSRLLGRGDGEVETKGFGG